MSVSTGVGIALILLKTVRELNLAYFSLLKSANLTEEEKAMLRKKFKEVSLDLIPKPEDLK